jgi:hypothetical protein
MDEDKQIMLYLYAELPEAERKAFEQRIKNDKDLSRKVERMRHLHGVLNTKPVPEPSPVQLDSLRLKLRDRIRAERRRLTWRDKIKDWTVIFTERRFILEFAVAVALVFMGIAIGRNGDVADAPVTHTPGETAAGVPLQIDDVEALAYDPASGLVTARYRTVQQVTATGTITDNSIRQILSHAIRSEQHPGRRLAAVKAMSKRSFNDRELEAALIYAMENDSIAGVRLKAAAVLSGLTLTPAIKEAFITTLLKDDNSAVRIQALEALDSHILEQEVAPVFMNASRKDENEFVRIKASQALQRIEKIE